MKFNEAQQKERIANGVASLALAADVGVLIVLVSVFGWIAGGVWAALSTWGAVLHYRNVEELADPATEKELFTTSGDVRVSQAACFDMETDTK